jgi:hypothetical protein
MSDEDQGRLDEIQLLETIMGERLLEIMQRLDPLENHDWAELTEHQKEFYITTVNHFLCSCKEDIEKWNKLY